MNLYKHQQALLEKNPKKYLLNHETGTGKSIIAIELAKKNGQRALVICPKSIKQQWVDQIPADWLVLHKEDFKKNVGKVPAFNCVIVDECHFFANHKSQLSKALLAYLKFYKVEYVYLLTATSYTSSMWSLYSLGLYLGYTWKWIDWDRKFFTRIRMGRRNIPIQRSYVDGNPIQLVANQIVNQLGGTVTMEETLGDETMPEQIFETEYFELTTEQKKAIASLQDLQPIVRFTKCHQICGGSLKSDGYTEDQYFKSEKMSRLAELVSEHPKLVIICRYNHEVDMIAEAFNGLKINGEVKDRHSIVQEAEKATRCVLVVQAECAEGYELPSFPLMIFYSKSFSMVKFQQMIGRIHRRNRLKRNVYLSLIVKGTIDEDVHKCIQRKQDFDIAIYSKQNEKI